MLVHMCKEPSPAGALSPVLFHRLFRAIGDPTRVWPVDLLAERRRASSVSELAGCLDFDALVETLRGVAEGLERAGDDFEDATACVTASGSDKGRDS